VIKKDYGDGNLQELVIGTTAVALTACVADRLSKYMGMPNNQRRIMSAILVAGAVVLWTKGHVASVKISIV
jgi:hypothetical protein